MCLIGTFFSTHWRIIINNNPFNLWMSKNLFFDHENYVFLNRDVSLRFYGHGSVDFFFMFGAALKIFVRVVLNVNVAWEPINNNIIWFLVYCLTLISFMNNILVMMFRDVLVSFIWCHGFFLRWYLFVSNSRVIFYRYENTYHWNFSHNKSNSPRIYFCN